MNLRWNPSYQRWEAEFVDFQGDLAAVKAVGFRCDGPPAWVWHTSKAVVLSKLRENKPLSGLTINSDAKEQYVSLLAVEERNAATKAELAKANKALKKKLKEDEVDKKTPGMSMTPEGFLATSASDLPPAPPFEFKYERPTPPADLCVICQSPVYFYEYFIPLICCLWCSKICLDNDGEVC